LNLSEEIEQADALLDGLLGAARETSSTATARRTINKDGKTVVD
jgi:hypothetical protein